MSELNVTWDYSNCFNDACTVGCPGDAGADCVAVGSTGIGIVTKACIQCTLGKSFGYY